MTPSYWLVGRALSPPEGHGLQIGAMTRQRAAERSQLVEQHAPLLHMTMPLIAHTQIRNRGTIGGSLAHADPAADKRAIGGLQPTTSMLDSLLPTSRPMRC